MAKVCIICQKEAKSGYAVADDFVITTIRKIKKSLNIVKNNELIVTAECLAIYKKKRQNYERTLMIHVILAALIFAFMLFVALSSKNFSLCSLLVGILLAALLVGLALLSHMPKAEGIPVDSPANEKKESPKKKTQKK